MDKYSAIILAGGKGSRMKSENSKVLFELLSKPLIDWVIAALKESGAGEFCTVVGHRRELVKEHLQEQCEFAVQEEQLGTGHAVMMARDFLKKHKDESVAILSGDVPLITPETLKGAFEAHKSSGADATIITSRLADPFGYGRITRDASGKVEKIVEQRDATEEQKKIDEVNTGTYFFKAETLLSALDNLKTDNAQNEYYLTDAIAYINNTGGTTDTFEVDDITEMTGINDRAQLYDVSVIAKDRILTALMKSGVTIMDKASTFISPDAEIAPDTVILPSTIIKGQTKIGRACTVGPNAVLENVTLGDNVTFNASQAYDSVIGNNVKIGPFSHIRPGCDIADDCKVGAYVELKKAKFGNGTKAPHLSYIGDAELGSGVNFACGCITVNYDGKNKHKTIIKDKAFIGCNVNLVAPVTVEDGAYIAAGSTITDTVPRRALAIARARQSVKPGWRDKSKLEK
ncbi:MAG: bifunctional UDP-N-acetylglucosamine diphosphorylase/glucosamine-1-phosphate N-acetyltransferase GlmU [Clostridia bacterium]|nr:bifunctional UDP-N-acetylglucosamine diphosphorylase/glucosamine-1-phosphate N-acetyltransferase GlmU [Clostridia bacterium]